jgi:hypothetical protein
MARLPPRARNQFIARYLAQASRVIADRPSAPAQTLATELALELALQYLRNRGLSLTLSAVQSSEDISSTHRTEWPARILAINPRDDQLPKLCRITQGKDSPDGHRGPGYRLIAVRPRYMRGQLIIDPNGPDFDLSSSGDEGEGSDSDDDENAIDKLVEMIGGSAGQSVLQETTFREDENSTETALSGIGAPADDGQASVQSPGQVEEEEEEEDEISK